MRPPLPSRFRPPRRPARSIAGAALVAAAVALAALAGSASPPPARAASAGQLRRQIAGGQRQISRLSGSVASDTRRLMELDGAVSALASRVAGLQSQLSATVGELSILRGQLTAAQARLARLQATADADQQALSAQLVGTYEGGEPDLVDVVLESTGFQDLLERLTFVQRIGHQDTEVVARVRADREAVAAEAIHLGVLSTRQQQLASSELAQRNSVADEKLALVSEQLSVARLRASQAGRLSGAQSQVAMLSGQLNRLEAAQRAAAQRAAAQRATESQPSAASGPGGGSGGGPAPAPAPKAPAGRGFEFPMPPADVSPPSTWTLDDGVDIAAPGGTPELAVCSGTIVLHGIGGFGPSAPVIHCDSPIDGYDYVYYGHAGPGNWTPVGTHVAQGQVISQVGYGIVGLSSGPHLELGFADSSGDPIGPSSAPAMMSLLQAAYRG